MTDDERDAKRYRWLRLQDWTSSLMCVIRNPATAAKVDSDCPSHERLDAAIDVAMEQKP